MTRARNRDEFSVQIRDTLAKRVGQCCSNPACQRSTSGPHQEVHRVVNIGVASHITAASPGGPRYDSALSASERAGISNGVWLCQNCAKLVDSDVKQYTAELLLSWKRDAEFRADSELIGGSHVSVFLPQPAGAVHAPIPKMAGQTYHEARARLIEAGWQPRKRHWSHAHLANAQIGHGAEHWGKGYWEIINAWPTGLAQCTFGFHDVYGNLLTIMTQGEENAEHGCHARVCNWFFTKSD